MSMLGSFYMRGYFPKLDSIRFYAFLIVFISHAYLFCYQVGPYVNQWLLEKGSRIFAHGEVGVHIFFTLSGFLIMLLAIREYKTKGHMSIRGFFRRRILRIWPLYFLALLIGIYSVGVQVVDVGCVQKFWYFLGNFCMVDGLSDGSLSALIGPLWSVSVEEQFYILFPFVFALCAYAMNRYGRRVIAYTVGLIAVCVCVWALYSRYIHSEQWNYISYATISQLPSLFFGMLLAVIVSIPRYMNRVSNIVHQYRLQVIGLMLISFLSALYVKFTGPLGVSTYILLLCVTTGCMIVLSIVAPVGEGVAPVSLWAKITQYFGRISYGMYVYHMFAFTLIKQAFAFFRIENTSSWIALTQILAIFVLTTGMAHLSYRYIECFFLRYKSTSKVTI